jgi:hypothetical protein
MSDSYIIEVDCEAAGIVVRDGHGFRFFAATRPFHALEGQMFKNPEQARRAAVRQRGAGPPMGCSYQASSPGRALPNS